MQNQNYFLFLYKNIFMASNKIYIIIILEFKVVL